MRNKRYNDMLRFILKCQAPNEIETELKNEFIKIIDKQRLESVTSFESQHFLTK